MSDYISRADAMAYPLSWEHYDKENGSRDFICGVESYRDYIEALPSADAEPKMTEEVREALMRLTMCAREECDMCKYKDECCYDFQYKISTDNMNTLSDALLRSKCEVDAKSADAVPIYEDGTLEVKVPNAQKVGRVLVMDTDSHIGGGLFYPDDAVQGEWIFNPTDAIDLMFAKPKCSKCGFESSDGVNFCSNCGARMKGGDDE